MSQTFAFYGESFIEEPFVSALEAKGYTRVEDPASAQFIFSYLSAPGAAEELYFAEEGLFTYVNPGTYMVDMSANTLSFAREAHDLGQVYGFHMIDAPLVFGDVFSSDALSKPETMTVLAGGKEEDVAVVSELLTAFVGEVCYQGEAGTGQAARALVSLSCAAQIMALVEGMALTSSHESEALLGLCKSMNSLGILSDYSHAYACAIEKKNFESGIPTAVLRNELMCAEHIAIESDLVLPHADAARHLVAMYLIAGGEDLNPAGLSCLYHGREYSADYGLDWERLDQMFEQADHEGCSCDDAGMCDCGEAHSEDYLEEDPFAFFDDDFYNEADFELDEDDDSYEDE